MNAQRMTIKVQVLKPEAKIPAYAHSGDAGFDLYTIDFVEIQPGERKKIPLGLAFEIPDGYVGLVWDKSGLADRFGIHGLAGVIDCGYRGEVSVMLLNAGKEMASFEPGMKIAQMLIQKVEQVQFEEVKELSNTTRGVGGWGSTGMK